jgi:hypothetical protein
VPEGDNTKNGLSEEMAKAGTGSCFRGERRPLSWDFRILEAQDKEFGTGEGVRGGRCGKALGRETSGPLPQVG